MNRLLIYDVILHIFIVSYLSRARAVRMAKLLEDGLLENYEVPVGNMLEFPENYDGSSVTICFWLHPFRYFQSNSILSFGPSATAVSTLSISLQEGNFIVKLPECLLSLNIKPQIREWAHYCLSEAEDVNIFIGGESNSTHDCGLEKLFDTSQKNIFYRVGWDAQITNPFSGLVADLKIFWRELSLEEVKNVSMVNNIPTGFNLLSNLTTEPNSYIEITDITTEELVEEYMPYILLYISEKNIFERASTVCTVNRGLLPDFKKHGKATLARLMAKFSTHSGLSFGSFWLNSVSNSNCFIGTFVRRTLDLTESSEDCGNSRINYFCIVEKQVKYRLIGFNDDNDVVFHPVPYTIGIFETDDVYRMYLKNGEFILKDVTTDFVYFISDSKDSDTLLGRYNWHQADDILIGKEMTFSGCIFNDFTCSDGLCIDFKDLCQFQGNCDDYSDESVSLCEVGIPPRSFYDKRLPPSSLSNHTTNISIHFELLRVLDISRDDSTLSLLANCVLKWQDIRLEFKFLNRNESVTVRKEIADQYWQPELIIVGAIHDDESKLSFKDNPGTVKAMSLENGTLKVYESYKVLFYEGEQVLVISEISVPVTINCPMNLYYFPFDEQTCTFSLELVNDILSDIRWEINTANISMGSEVFHALYEIFDFQYTFINTKELQISIKLARNYGALVFNTILPCIALEVIGIISHMLPTHDYNDRVTTTVSCLIVIATLFSQISVALPESAEPKLIDIWMFAHILIFLQIYVDHVIVLRLDDAEYKRFENQKYLAGKKIESYLNQNQDDELNQNRSPMRVAKVAWENVSNFYWRFYNLELNTLTTNKTLMYCSIAVYATFLLFYFLVAGQYIK